MTRLRFAKRRAKIILILVISILIVVALGFTYMHFTKKKVMTWVPTQDANGNPITTTEQIVNQTKSDNDIIVYLRAIYFQNNTLFLSYSTKGKEVLLNQRYIEIYFNNELISTPGGGGMNRVQDTIYLCSGYPLKKYLTHGDKVTIWLVKSDGEKTNIKFDLIIQ